MAYLAPSPSSSTYLLRPKIPKFPIHPSHLSIRHFPTRLKPSISLSIIAAAAKVSASGRNPKQTKEKEVKKQDEEAEVEVEEDLPWIQEKALDVVEFTGSVTQAIPGPRVGTSSLPWILAVPLAYLGITFAMAVVKTVKKFNSPIFKRKQVVSKNAMLCLSIDELFQKGSDAVDESAIQRLVKKTGFSAAEILRKYVRYAVYEKEFNPDLLACLVQLRKACKLDDSQVAEVLDEISRRIVRKLGPIVMDLKGYSKSGSGRQLALRYFFELIFYLSEYPDFCSRDSSLSIKEIFGVTDDDVDKLRKTTRKELGDVDWLEKMVGNQDSDADAEEEK